MKKKFNFWLNIVTICFCVCAIAVGVYSATIASITASGKIGFTAHGCEGTVSGTIVGHANSADATHLITPEKLNAGKSVAFSDANGLPIGDRYFSDVASSDGSIEPIILTLTVTNTSLYAIEATLTLPTNQQGITFDTENAIMQLGEKNSTTATQSMTIIMTLATGSESFSLRAISFNLDFVRHTIVKGDTTNGHYIIMGSNVVNNVIQPVKWIPFAKYTTTTKQWEHVDAKTEIDLTAQYYFISEKVLDVGDLGESPDLGQFGVSFNNYQNYYNNYAHGLYPTVKLINYLASNIRQFLKSTKESPVSRGYIRDGEFEVPDSEKVNLLTEYGIGGYIYNKITSRTAEELYIQPTADLPYASLPSELKSNVNASDKLWILSGDELCLMAGRIFDYTDLEGDASLAATAFHYNVSGVYWWTRNSSSPTSGIAVQGSGTGYGYAGNKYGVRPGFQINLGA